MAKGKKLGEGKPTRIEIAVSQEDKAIIDKMANLKKLLGEKETVSDMVRAYLLKTAKRYLEDHKDLIDRLAKRTQRDFTSLTPSINDDPGEEEQSSEPIEETITDTPSADPEPEAVAEIIPEETSKPKKQRTKAIREPENKADQPSEQPIKRGELTYRTINGYETPFNDEQLQEGEQIIISYLQDHKNLRIRSIDDFVFKLAEETNHNPPLIADALFTSNRLKIKGDKITIKPQ